MPQAARPSPSPARFGGGPMMTGSCGGADVQHRQADEAAAAQLHFPFMRTAIRRLDSQDATTPARFPAHITDRHPCPRISSEAHASSTRPLPADPEGAMVLQIWKKELLVGCSIHVVMLVCLLASSVVIGLFCNPTRSLLPRRRCELLLQRQSRPQSTAYLLCPPSI